MAGGESTGQSIFIIDKYFKLYFKNALKEYDLNNAEAMVLLILYGNENHKEHLLRMIPTEEGKTQEQIINELHYDKGVMTRTMQSLEGKGFVTRNQNPSDNRSYIFTQTEKAKDFMPTLFSILSAWNNLLMKDVEELEIVQRGILKMAENAMSYFRGEVKNDQAD